MDEQGLERSAILLMTLGEETAAEVFRQLTPKEFRRIGETMTRLRSVTRERVGEVLVRFAKLIRTEHPQIIASILVHLEQDHAWDILLRLPARTHAEVILRVAALDSIQPNALRELNDVLSQILAGADKLKKSALGGPKISADMPNGLGTTLEAGIIQWIRETDPDLAQSIEDQMFTFEDLTRLEDRAVQRVLREVASDALVIALKGSGTDIREKILRNLSQRAAEGLRDDLESRGPVRLSEVEAQQKEILKVIRTLADSGEIALGAGGEDAFV